MSIKNKLGIWGNESCVQCGACCYLYKKMKTGEACPNQEIRDGRSYCRIHDKPFERLQCEVFFCGDLDKSLKNYPDKAEILRDIAAKLGTVPESSANYKSSTPQSYLQKDQGFH